MYAIGNSDPCYNDFSGVVFLISNLKTSTGIILFQKVW